MIDISKIETNDEIRYRIPTIGYSNGVYIECIISKTSEILSVQHIFHYSPDHPQWSTWQEYRDMVESDSRIIE